MKKLIFISAVMSMILSGQVIAGQPHSYDYATVIKAVPAYETVHHDIPVRRCHSSSPRRYHNHSPHSHHPGYSATPTIAGAIIGGAIGNAIGHNKRNKKVGLVAGAMLGGAIGHDISHHQRRYKHSHQHQKRHYRKNRRCTVSYEPGDSYRQLTGYHVTYYYKGERYQTFTHEHPGHKIKVQVNVTPVDQRY